MRRSVLQLQVEEKGLIVANIHLHTIVHSSNLGTLERSHLSSYDLMSGLNGVEGGELLVQSAFNLSLEIGHHLLHLLINRSTGYTSTQHRSH